MKFAPGEVLVRRQWRGGRLQRLHVVRVAADDERGLRLWLSTDSSWWRLVGPDDGGDQSRARLVREVWTGSDALIWMPAQTPYSVWWLWSDGSFAGWRVTIEEPHVRWADRGCAGVDTAEQVLEVIVRPDHTWRCQDAEGRRVDYLLSWDDCPSAEVRTATERVVKLVEARQFPFDGTWCGFRPDASWTVPALPAGYDRPRAAVVRA